MVWGLRQYTLHSIHVMNLHARIRPAHSHIHTFDLVVGPHVCLDTRSHCIVSSVQSMSMHPSPVSPSSKAPPPAVPASPLDDVLLLLVAVDGLPESGD